MPLDVVRCDAEEDRIVLQATDPSVTPMTKELTNLLCFMIMIDVQMLVSLVIGWLTANSTAAILGREHRVILLNCNAVG